MTNHLWLQIRYLHPFEVRGFFFVLCQWCVWYICSVDVYIWCIWLYMTHTCQLWSSISFHVVFEILSYGAMSHKLIGLTGEQGSVFCCPCFLELGIQVLDTKEILLRGCCHPNLSYWCFYRKWFSYWAILQDQSIFIINIIKHFFVVVSGLLLSLHWCLEISSV